MQILGASPSSTSTSIIPLPPPKDRALLTVDVKQSVYLVHSRRTGAFLTPRDRR